MSSIHWHLDPIYMDELNNAKIVLDSIERVGTTKVTSGPITMDDVPSFIKNRYEPKVVRFIRLLMEAKRQRSLPQTVEQEKKSNETNIGNSNRVTIDAKANG